MRGAILAALAADPAVTALVGARIRARVALLGGLEPADFGPEGELVGPAIVVVMETRTRETAGPDDGKAIEARQTFALYVYDREDYGAIKAVHKAARRVLHRKRLAPVAEDVRWRDTRWQALTPEQVDMAYTPALAVMTARYDANVADPID